jgi:hypothetical protein
MTVPAQTEDPQSYEPSAAQVERAAALRRFNWLYVYAPLGLLALLALVLVGLLAWGVLSPHVVGTAAFASGLADIIIILTIIPLQVLCAIVPLAAIGYVLYRRQQPKREHGRLQTLFWKIDTFLDKAAAKVDTALPKAANPVIRGYALAAYWRTFINAVKKLVIRR